MIGDFDAAFRLRDRVEKVRDKYDLIIIDTPPTLGMITVNALVAANHVLIPIQSSYFALEGTDDLFETSRRSVPGQIPTSAFWAFWLLCSTVGPLVKGCGNTYSQCIRQKDI